MDFDQDSLHLVWPGVAKEGAKQLRSIGPQRSAKYRSIQTTHKNANTKPHQTTPHTRTHTHKHKTYTHTQTNRNTDTQTPTHVRACTGTGKAQARTRTHTHTAHSTQHTAHSTHTYTNMHKRAAHTAHCIARTQPGHVLTHLNLLTRTRHTTHKRHKTTRHDTALCRTPRDTHNTAQHRTTHTHTHEMNAIKSADQFAKLASENGWLANSTPKALVFRDTEHKAATPLSCAAMPCP